MAQTMCLPSFGPVFCPYLFPTLLALSLIALRPCCLFVLAIVVVVVVVEVSEEAVVWSRLLLLLLLLCHIAVRKTYIK